MAYNRCVGDDPVPAGMTIVFVNMPVAAIERPSIALGTLKAILARDGIACDVAYANLWYAEHIGLDNLQLIEATRPQDALGDWLFGSAAFPGFDADDVRYAEQLLLRHPALAAAGRQSVERLLSLKRQSADFLDRVADRILAARPTLVGCTSMFQQNVASLALLRRIRQRSPDIVTMMGGANCETVMGRSAHRHFDWIDYVVSGEADGLIAGLCRDVLAVGREIPVDRVPFGVLAPCHRRDGYPTTPNGDGVPRAIVDDIRDVPTPDYGDYFTELDGFLYGADIFPALPIETSRGCWWGAKSHCTFCGLNGSSMSFRAKPPEQALGDIERLVERHRVTRIQAVDNILDTGYIDTLVPLLAARDPILSIFYEVKANLKRGQVAALAEGGIRSLQPGIESLDSRVLRLMRKGCGAWQNILLLKWARQYGLGLAWTIIYGFPGEEDDWHAQTAAFLPLLHHFQPGGISLLRYDRYSPYFRRQADWNLELRAGWAYRHIYPLPATELDEIAYFMEDTGVDAGKAGYGPGMQALAAAHAEWRRANRAAGPPTWKMPVLSMRRLAGGDAVVTDTRDCGIADGVTLDPCDVELLDRSDLAPTEARLVEGLADRFGIDGGDLARRVERLCTFGFCLRIDGRVVGLVLDEPVAHRLRIRDRPNGYVRPVRAQRRIEKILSLEPPIVA